MSRKGQLYFLSYVYRILRLSTQQQNVYFSFFDLLDEEVDQPTPAAPVRLNLRERLSAELRCFGALLFSCHIFAAFLYNNGL